MLTCGSVLTWLCTTGPAPSAVDTQLSMLRAVAESRGSGGGSGKGSRGSTRAAHAVTQGEAAEGAQLLGTNMPGPKGADDRGVTKPSSPGLSASSGRTVGPRLLDHKLRPLRAAKPAPPLLVFSSGLADSYKMITQVRARARVHARRCTCQCKL